MGRKTNGGLVRRSIPVMLATGLGVVVRVGLADGDGDGDADGEGDGEGDGDAAGGACRVKLAHFTGGPDVQMLCRPGGSLGNEVTTLLKEPAGSVVTAAITFDGLSQ